MKMSGFHPKDLINEVKIRPGIYNKDELVHPKRDHKHQLWMEVAERLTPPDDWESYTDVEKEARMDEISTKWKHLKDHFYREIKLQEAGEAHKKRKYIYFDDLEFMRPYVGFKLPPINKRNNKSYDESLDDTQDYINNDPDIDMDDFLKSTETLEDDADDSEYKVKIGNSPTSEPRSSEPRSKRVIRPTAKVQQNKNDSNTPLAKPNESVNKSNIQVKKSNTSSNPHFKIRDGDISFSLSLVPTLRKLGDGLKLRAKVDILQILQKHIEELERKNAGSNHNTNQIAEIDEDMNEDHLEECEETITIKHEQHDDPLNGGGSNKTWWT